MRGGCLCGAIRYELEAKIESIDHCHCSMCRRSHGAAFATYGKLPREAVVLREGKDRVKAYSSSEAVSRSFCPECGSNLFFEHTAMPDSVFLAIGSLDEDPGLRPEFHIFVDSKAPWFEITDALPQHAGYPAELTE